MNNPLVQLDPGLFIWTILTFLLLLTVLAKFAWKPLLKMDTEAVEFYYNKLDRNKFVEFDYDKNWDVLKVDGVEQYFGPDGCHFNVKGHKMFFEKYVEPNLPIELDAQI